MEKGTIMTPQVRLKHDPGDPSIQIIPTLGPTVCKYYLHWAIWIPRVGQRLRLYHPDRLKSSGGVLSKVPGFGV